MRNAESPHDLRFPELSPRQCVSLLTFTNFLTTFLSRELWRRTGRILDSGLWLMKNALLFRSARSDSGQEEREVSGGNAALPEHKVLPIRSDILAER